MSKSTRPAAPRRTATSNAGRMLARKIQELTDNGDELATFAIGLFRANSIADKVDAMRRYGLENITDQMRLEMFNWLSDRGFGKPMQAIDITIDDDRSMSDEELIDSLLRSFGVEELRAAAERMERVKELEAGTEPAEGETIQ